MEIFSLVLAYRSNHDILLYFVRVPIWCYTIISCFIYRLGLQTVLVTVQLKLVVNVINGSVELIKNCIIICYVVLHFSKPAHLAAHNY